MQVYEAATVPSANAKKAKSGGMKCVKRYKRSINIETTCLSKDAPWV